MFLPLLSLRNHIIRSKSEMNFNSWSKSGTFSILFDHCSELLRSGHSHSKMVLDTPDLLVALITAGYKFVFPESMKLPPSCLCGNEMNKVSFSFNSFSLTLSE